MADEDDTDAEDTTTGEDEKGATSEKEGDKVPPAVKAALRKANKEAETYRLKLKEIEDRDKSEVEKAADRATVAETRANEAEVRALRLEVAAEKGLTLAQAKHLVGTTKEDLESYADELMESFGAAGNGDGGNGRKPATGGRPKEKLRPGHVPDATEEEPDMDKVADQVFRQSRGGS